MTPKQSSARTTSTLCLLACFVATGSAADPTLVLAGPGELSGNETVIDFDDQGFVAGDAIPVLSGVDFQMTDGSPAVYSEDPFPREFGPAGAGATNNFTGAAFPYPDLSLAFDAPIHNLAFAMRANSRDKVQLTFWVAGTMVDQLTLPTRGSDQLYFYGFHNAGGFDEVLVDVLGNPFLRTGAFSFDNLTFDGSGGDAPAAYSCVGFDSPVDGAMSHSPEAERLARLGRSIHRKLLTARLMDADGLEVTGADVLAPPVVRVSLAEARGGEEVDVTILVAVGGDDRFVAGEDGTWSIELDLASMSGPGSFRASMESGDELEYTIEPTCENRIVRKR